MNKKALSSEFIFQLFSLVIAVLLVHAGYVTVVQPNASEALIEEAILINEDPAYVPERNLFVVVKDLEQEACFVLMLWAIALMSFKARETFRERSLLGRNLIPIDGLTRILPQDTREYARSIEALSEGERPILDGKAAKPLSTDKTHRGGDFSTSGRSLPSQNAWSTKGKALVTDVPITYLGYVNRDTGVIEEPGHPLDGVAIQDTILIYPKGSGSTVAPFILMGLIYTNKGPKAIVNRDVCPLTLPAASLLNVPYAHGFGEDPCMEINTGDEVEMRLENGSVMLQVVNRTAASP